ncbi:hypothetical protein PRUB_b0359 [Pseudoalteromonas rubra]|uniref:Uncharacterized protein n=1 Tax=Pseudoalteromonas rubra TaxID=43658 RepID=A0A8T0BYW3_9GAMM|nr:hypothetical protein PRUB_b0359 [Pseudoalteromonas rubra]
MKALEPITGGKNDIKQKGQCNISGHHSDAPETAWFFTQANTKRLSILR